MFKQIKTKNFVIKILITSILFLFQFNPVYCCFNENFLIKIEFKDVSADISLQNIPKNDSNRTNFTFHQKSRNFIEKNLFAFALIGGGIIFNDSKFEKELKRKFRDKIGSDFHTPIDDFIQFAPVAQMYFGDIIGLESKNHWFDQSKYLFSATLLSSAIVVGLKKIINKKRPDGNQYAFPSGHTSVAFTNAGVLWNEFHETHPIYAYSGFLFAGTTGTLRIANNRHWFSDVLAGAGIGILCTNIIYKIQPLKDFNPFKNHDNITMLPSFSSDGFHLNFSYKW